MCGIFGLSCKSCIKDNTKFAVAITSQLQTEKHRGSDSYGVLTASGGKFYSIKGLGEFTKERSVKVLEALNEALPNGSQAFLGHVRAATHGEPNIQNAHPLLNEEKNMAVVHNGHVKIMSTIMEKTMAENHVFGGGTDSESILHVFEENMKSKSWSNVKDLFEATKETERGLSGYMNFIILLPDGKTIVVYSEGTLEKWVWKEGCVVALASEGVEFKPPPNVKGDWEDVPSGTVMIIRDGQVLKEDRIKNYVSVYNKNQGIDGYMGRREGGYVNRGGAFSRIPNLGAEDTETEDEYGCPITEGFKIQGDNGIVIFASSADPRTAVMEIEACWECGKDISKEVTTAECDKCYLRYCTLCFPKHSKHEFDAAICIVCKEQLSQSIVCIQCKDSFCLKDAKAHQCKPKKFRICDPINSDFGTPHEVKWKKAVKCGVCNRFFCKGHRNKHKCLTPKQRKKLQVSKTLQEQLDGVPITPPVAIPYVT